jgi:hypothetical protein
MCKTISAQATAMVVVAVVVPPTAMAISNQL